VNGEAVISLWPYYQSDNSLIGNNKADLNLNAFTPREYNSQSGGAYLTTKNAIKYRVVSACLRFKYTGAPLSAQGSRVGAFLPTMASGDANYSIDAMRRQPVSNVERVSEEFRCIWVP